MSTGRSTRAFDKKVFYRQLSTLLSAGFPLSSALLHVEEGTMGTPGEAISLLRAGIGSGQSLAGAMSADGGNLFTPLEKGVVEAGEASGNLPESLARLAEYFEFSTSFKKKVGGGIVYPAILIHLAVIIPAIPVLVLRGLLPFLARIIPFFSALYLCIFGLVFISKRLNSSPRLSEKRDFLLLGIPWLGRLVKKVETIRFLKSFSTLYSAGVGVVRAVELAGETTGNISIKKDISRAVSLLKKGHSLSETFSGSEWLAVAPYDMLKTGEASVTMYECLNRVASYLKEEADAAAEQLARLLPVAVYLLAALYIAYTVIRFYSGYFRIFDSLM